MKFWIAAAICASAFSSISSAQTTSSAMLVAETEQRPREVKASNDGLTLRLICRGTGEHRVENFGTAFAFSRRGTSTAFGVGTQMDQFGEQLDIDIISGRVKVRVPRRMLPKLHGGVNGWFDVSELVIEADEIRGKVKLNFNEHPNLRVDRRTGSVALDGKVGSFAGQCEKDDTTRHAF